MGSWSNLVLGCLSSSHGVSHLENDRSDYRSYILWIVSLVESRHSQSSGAILWTWIVIAAIHECSSSRENIVTIRVLTLSTEELSFSLKITSRVRGATGKNRTRTKTTKKSKCFLLSKSCVWFKKQFLNHNLLNTNDARDSLQTKMLLVYAGSVRKIWWPPPPSPKKIMHNMKVRKKNCALENCPIPPLS